MKKVPLLASAENTIIVDPSPKKHKNNDNSSCSSATLSDDMTAVSKKRSRLEEQLLDDDFAYIDSQCNDRVSYFGIDSQYVFKKIKYVSVILYISINCRRLVRKVTEAIFPRFLMKSSILRKFYALSRNHSSSAFSRFLSYCINRRKSRALIEFTKTLLLLLLKGEGSIYVQKNLNFIEKCKSRDLKKSYC